MKAKEALGQPLTDEDYAKIEIKETKLREETNMQNYVNNIAESYGRDSKAVMEEMLKLNGCDSVAELQAKVARGESIVEASDTAWNARIQKQHYAAYDKMLEAQRLAQSLNANNQMDTYIFATQMRNNKLDITESLLYSYADYLKQKKDPNYSELRATTQPLNIAGSNGCWIEPNPDASAWVMNFDFGMDFGDRAGEHFSNGEYFSGALYSLGGIGDAILDTAAIAGGARGIFLASRGLSATASLIQNNISNIAIFSNGAIIGITPGIPMPTTNSMAELFGIAVGYVGSKVYEEKERLEEWFRNEE